MAEAHVSEAMESSSAKQMCSFVGVISNFFFSYFLLCFISFFFPFPFRLLFLL